MRIKAALLGAVIAVSACGGSAAPPTTDVPAIAGRVANTAPRATAAATTPATVATTVAPTATVGPTPLSQAARVAVQDCLDALGPNSKDFIRTLVSVRADPALSALAIVQTTCDHARTQLLADSPHGGDPGFFLASAEQTMNSAFQFAHPQLPAGNDTFTEQGQKLVQDAVDAFELAATGAGVKVSTTATGALVPATTVAP